MLLGNITGKISTTEFNFLVKGEAKKFQYVQVLDESGNYVLGQVVEIERDKDKTIASCIVLGYREEGRLKQLRIPLAPGQEVLRAEDDFIKQTLDLEEKENSGYIGKLEGRDNLNVYIDLNKLLTKHVSILAKTGYGKSYTVAVLLEELLERDIPLVIIDPHGEYTSLKYPNDKDKENLISFGIKSKGFIDKIQEFSPNVEDNKEAKPLKLNSTNLEGRELIHLLPARLNSTQLSLLYSALKNLDDIGFDQLIVELEAIDHSARWTLIDVIEYLKKLELFSENFTSVHELVKPGKASIINLRGVPKEVQEVVVYKLINDLFNERKRGNIPPFFLVLEEAHNYLPERSFGESKSSAILRQVFSEGRKFGLGACLISQRPSRVDKSALSQCTTQIILKVTNPLDIKAIVNSVEGITYETEKEIRNLGVGNAMIVGVVDMPIFVNIRPRKSKHGGEAIKIVDEALYNKNISKEIKDFKDRGELLPVVNQRISLNDYKIINGLKDVKIRLIPCGLLFGENFNVLVNLNNGEIIENIENGRGFRFNELRLSSKEKQIFSVAVKLKEFSASDLFSKSQMQFNEVYDVINGFVSKGIFMREDANNFKVARNYDFHDFLRKAAFYGSVEFSRVSGEKLEGEYNLNEVSEELNDFMKIKDKKQCWLVSYS